MNKIYGLVTLWAGVVGVACITSHYNFHGRTELAGNVVAKENNCNALEKTIGTEEKDDCTTLAANTSEGNYVIGMLGEPEDHIKVGSKVKFLKQSSYWVTSFNANRMGFLTAENIKLED